MRPLASGQIVFYMVPGIHRHRPRACHLVLLAAADGAHSGAMRTAVTAVAVSETGARVVCRAAGPVEVAHIVSQNMAAGHAQHACSHLSATARGKSGC